MVFITRPDIVSDMVASAKTIINPSAEDPVVVVCADGAQSERVRSIDLGIAIHSNFWIYVGAL